MVHRLGCFPACGIFPDQGWNPRLQRQQADSFPRSHQGSPGSAFICLCVCISSSLRESVFIRVCFSCLCVSQASVWVCSYTPGSVYMSSCFSVSVFMTASVRLCFSCLCVRLCTLICVSVFIIASVFLVCLRLYARDRLYLLLFPCVRIYHCICTSVFFMHP